MPELPPEQQARQQIDAMLVGSGWVVQDYKAFNPSASRGIALREVPLTSRKCDYLLLVDRKAVGVVEAKRVGATLSTVAEQSGYYGGKPSVDFSTLGAKNVSYHLRSGTNDGTQSILRMPHRRECCALGRYCDGGRKATVLGWKEADPLNKLR